MSSERAFLRSPECRVQESLPPIDDTSFPLPDRADTFARPLSDADAASLLRRQGFAQFQAEAANDILRIVQTEFLPDMAQGWAALYNALVGWRCGLNFTPFAWTRPNALLRFAEPITDVAPNCDLLGKIGTLRAGAEWDESCKQWVGGQETPASRIYETSAQWAQQRFYAEGQEGDELRTTVYLPDGQQVYGNRILRGASARRLAKVLKSDLADEGHDVSRFEIVPSLVYTVTADAADREVIFWTAMDALAQQKPGGGDELTWSNIAYLLYQSPQNKRGSDAVIRTILVASAAYYLNRAVMLPQDIDLRAYTHSQPQFVSFLSDQICEAPKRT